MINQSNLYIKNKIKQKNNRQRILIQNLELQYTFYN